MNKILQNIIEFKKAEVLKNRKDNPVKNLMAIAEGNKSKKQSFLEKIKDKDNLHIIAEIKKFSPLGNIKKNFDLKKNLKIYEDAGVSGLSICTEKKFFKGDIEDLRQAKENSSFAIMQNDFIISSYQIYEAAAFGVDAILLMPSVLSFEKLKDYIALSRSLNMEIILEVSQEKDIHSGEVLDIDIFGLSNQKENSFQTDLRISMKLAKNIDEDKTIMVLNGISNKSDIDEYKDFGLNNFIISEALMNSEEPENFLKTFFQKEEVKKKAGLFD